MDDRDLVHVKEYHRRLIEISKQEQNLRKGRPARPGLKDFVLHRSESKLSLITPPVLLIIFLMAITLFSSCTPAPQIPVTVANTSISQPRPTATVAATPTAGIGSTQVSLKDGMVMVFVPSGEFKMGGPSHATDSLPIHTVHLDAFWIDQTEVTNAMFAKFIESTDYVTDAQKAGVSNEYRTTDQGDYFEEVRGLDWNHPHGEQSNVAGIEDHPVVHVSWNDAQAYCTWAERRLPTEAEWEKAASWNDPLGEKYDFPWGDDFDGTLLNFCDINCSLAYAIKYMDDGYAETSPVGNYPNGASPYGALDMSGNVMEWVADWYGENYYKDSPSSNPLGPDSGENRVQRGGAWATNNNYVSPSDRFGWEPSFSAFANGFRCALSP